MPETVLLETVSIFGVSSLIVSRRFRLLVFWGPFGRSRLNVSLLKPMYSPATRSSRRAKSLCVFAGAKVCATGVPWASFSTILAIAAKTRSFKKRDFRIRRRFLSTPVSSTSLRPINSFMLLTGPGKVANGPKVVVFLCFLESFTLVLAPGSY